MSTTVEINVDRNNKVAFRDLKSRTCFRYAGVTYLKIPMILMGGHVKLDRCAALNLNDLKIVTDFGSNTRVEGLGYVRLTIDNGE